ncbi:MAG: hypothetical protein LBS77_03200 [Desulfovibrio sp.]|nr:hypothetical protein [Desulfovibrio sp.]
MPVFLQLLFMPLLTLSGKFFNVPLFFPMSHALRKSYGVQPPKQSDAKPAEKLLASIPSCCLMEGRNFLWRNWSAAHRCQKLNVSSKIADREAIFGFSGLRTLMNNPAIL